MNIENNKFLNIYNEFKNEKFLLDEKIHLILLYGGIKGYYYIGTNFIINKYINYNKIKSITGVSAGSLSAVFLACKLDINILTNLAKLFIVDGHIRFNTVLKILKKECIKFLPKDAYKICNKKNVKIILTKVSFLKFETVIKDNFNSNNELIKYIIASSTIPFLTHNTFPYCTKINSEYYIDGCFSFNEILTYGNTKKLIINSSKICVNNYNIFSLNENSINKIILDGAYDMYYFLKKQNNTNNIYFYEKEIKNKIKYDINSILIFKLIIIFYIISSTLIFFYSKNKSKYYNILIYKKLIIDIIVLLLIFYLFILKYFNNY